MIVKSGIIAVLIGIISSLHILYHGSEPGIHVLHQQLFYVPLILTSFWFGLRSGAALAIVISLLYGVPMILRMHGESGHLVVFTQVCLYFFVSMLIGWLSDRERRQQSKLFQNERVTALGKAASGLSFEVQDIVRQIENIHHRSKGKETDDHQQDTMLLEINRLKELLEALGQFNAPLTDAALSHDLNELILQRMAKYQQSAGQKGVKVVANLDQRGCPSMVTTEAIPRVIDSLVDNAIDVSLRGQSIVVRSERQADFCTVQVVDSGPGVSKEDEEKLFSVFFTTKPDGYGLSLSSGRKALRDLGGDVFYSPNEGGGAIFTMKIPRESEGENLQDYVRSALPGRPGGKAKA